MSSCPVVKIKFNNEQGFCLLNESDFDETKHDLFTEPPENESSLTTGDAKTEQTATAAKTQDAGAAATKPAWAAKKSKS